MLLQVTIQITVSVRDTEVMAQGIPELKKQIYISHRKFNLIYLPFTAIIVDIQSHSLSAWRVGRLQLAFAQEHRPYFSVHASQSAALHNTFIVFKVKDNGSSAEQLSVSLVLFPHLEQLQLLVDGIIDWSLINRFHHIPSALCKLVLWETSILNCLKY